MQDQAKNFTKKIFCGYLVAFILCFVAMVGYASLVMAKMNLPSEPTLIWRALTPLAIVSLILILSPVRRTLSVLGLIGFLCAIWFVLDFGYYLNFHAMTTVNSTVGAKQLWVIRHDILQSFSAILFLPALVFLLAFPVNKRLRRHFETQADKAMWWQLRRYFIGTGLVGVILFTIAFSVAWVTPIHQKTHDKYKLKWVLPNQHWLSRFSSTGFVRAFGIYNYHVKDIYKFVKKRISHRSVPQDYIKQLHKIFKSRHLLNNIKSPLFGTAKGYNVVILQLESFQDFVLGLKVGGEEVTPVLNRLLKKSLHTNYLFDSSSVGRTSDTEYMVMTGMLPHYGVPTATNFATNTHNGLAKLLHELNYKTHSFCGSELSFWNRNVTHQSYGIKQLHFQNVIAHEGLLGLGVSDGDVANYMAKKLKTLPQPFMAYWISVTSHFPYDHYPKAYDKKFNNAKVPDPIVLHYLRSVNYADHVLGELLKKMQAEGLTKKTMFIIYGDHDAGWFASQHMKGFIEKRLDKAEEDKVVFMIYIPDQVKKLLKYQPEFKNRVGALHDIFPTILHLVGAKIPKAVYGTHLFVKNCERALVPLAVHHKAFVYKGAIYQNGKKYALTPEECKVEKVPAYQEALFEIFLNQIVHENNLLPKIAKELKP